MPRVCSICTHPERPAIDMALVNGAAFRNIAARFGTSATALVRHKGDHLPASLTRARDAEEVAQADTLLDQIKQLQTITLRILAAAEADGKYVAAIMAVKEARGNLELLAKMVGELDERPQVNIMASPQWVSIQAIMLEMTGDDPERRRQLADRLAEIGA